MSARLEIVPVAGLGEIAPGDRLGEAIAAAGSPRHGEVIVVSQKVVSKAEGRVVRLASIEPGEEARTLARRLEKDPALVELVLRESRRLVRAERGVLIAETHSGLVCANAGIDASNLAEPGTVTLLPANPDASARRLRAEIATACASRPAVVVDDSFGRPWRLGQTDVAIGCAGLVALDDWRGRRDRGGGELAATAIAIADEAAAAADLIRDKASGIPAVVVRGLSHHVTDEDGPGAAALRRPADEDLFR